MAYNWAGYANTMSIPSGTIVLWNGNVASIPNTWALCDGNNGTPDLRDVFVVGAKQDSSSIAKSNITGSLLATGGSTSSTLPAGATVSAGTDLSKVATAIPPFYALVYMMKI